jgi:hypothetical protein
MSPLTTLHYLLIAILALLFIIGLIFSMQTKSKLSMLTTVTLVLGFIGFFSWRAINENVYLVEVTNLDKERYYQSEQILIKGIVRNVGNYPVANVVAVVRLSNSTGGAGGKNDSIFSQPTVFAEIFDGDDPKFVRQNIIEEHPIADYINPGKGVPFKIMMDYPSHFKNASYDVTAKAAY